PEPWHGGWHLPCHVSDHTHHLQHALVDSVLKLLEIFSPERLLKPFNYLGIQRAPAILGSPLQAAAEGFGVPQVQVHRVGWFPRHLSALHTTQDKIVQTERYYKQHH